MVTTSGMKGWHQARFLLWTSFPSLGEGFPSRGDIVLRSNSLIQQTRARGYQEFRGLKCTGTKLLRHTRNMYRRISSYEMDCFD